MYVSDECDLEKDKESVKRRQLNKKIQVAKIGTYKRDWKKSYFDER